MRKSVIAGIFIAVLAFAGLAGCGRSGDNSDAASYTNTGIEGNTGANPGAYSYGSGGASLGSNTSPEPTPTPRITRIEGDFSFPSYRGDGSGRDFTAAFVWDEEYFAGLASRYNPSLATMSLAFAMAAFASTDEIAGPTRGQAWNAMDMLSQIGFDGIETNYYFTTVPHEDSMGVVAANKEIVADGRYYTLLAIATRGSGYGMEWAGNFTVGALGYHEGFRLAAEETLRFVEDYVARHGQYFHENIKIWITGYSRGAAVANLFAAWVSNDEEIAGLALYRENIYAYTFGTPRAVPEAFIQGQSLHTNIHNVLSPADIVTWVTPHRWGYGRYGVDRFMPERGQIGDPAAFDEMLEFLYALGTERAHRSVVRAGEQVAGVVSASGRLIHVTETFEYVRFDRVTLLPPGINLAYSPGLMTPFLLEITNGLAAGAVDQENYVIMLEGLLRALIAGALGEERFVGDRMDLAIDIFMSKFGLHNALEIGLAFAADGVRGLALLAARYLHESILEAGIDLDGGFTLAGALLNSFEYIGLNGALTLVNNLDALAAAHYPEFMLAWMKSQDINFGGEFREFIPVFRRVGVSGPVRLRVYDEMGNLVAWFGDHEYIGALDSHIVFVAGEDMVVYLPADSGYRVELAATGDGTLDVAVSEFSLVLSDYSRVESWLDVAVLEGDLFTLDVPAFAGNDTGAPVYGSNVDYSFDSATNYTPRT